MKMTDPLIRTKLRLPYIRPELVLRPRLQNRIRQGLRGPLTLVTAPAGFGKTTLVASCVADSSLPVAWLSLDKDDNREARFLTYMIAALQEADHTIGSEATQLLSVSQTTISELVLTSLVNDLDTVGKDISLVLDDYHVINNPSVHASVVFLLEHCPRTLHLVIASRSDAPFRLARMRARGQVVELRSADLSFTQTEAVQFLNDIMGLHLDTRSIELLETRTEGWIAGLQMAALSIREREDIPGFIEGFSGTNRYILDYLLEEVLTSQSAEIQQFLLYTSILERLTPPLCDAVLAHDEDSAGKEGDRATPAPFFNGRSAAILENLERKNLFLVPLDDTRTWYRYHHLFNDLLRARLQQTLNSHALVGLHTQAAQWYEKNGMTYEAIYHASLTSDDAWVERLIEQNYTDMMQRGESLSIRFWTGKLSKELVYKRPLLCIHEAMSHAWFGQVDAADDFLAQAEKHLQGECRSHKTEYMMGYAAYVKSRVVAMRGDVQHAILLAQTAREYIPTNNQSLQGGIGVMLGYAYFLDGDFVNAVQTLTETIQAGIRAEIVNTTTGAYCVLARLHAVQGRLHEAHLLYQEADRFIQNVGGQHRGAQSIVDVGKAELLYEWNDLDAAFTHIKQGLALIQFWSKADDIALAYTIYSQIQQAQGNTAAAAETIEKASQLIQASGVFSEAHNAVMTTRVRQQLAQGNSLAVSRWSESHRIDFDSSDELRFENELANVMLVRVCMAQGKMDEALVRLSRLEANAQLDKRMGRLIEIKILKALALQKMENAEQALTLVESILALAEPERYVRVFLNEGHAMQMLIAQWLARAGTHPHRDYAVHLLSQFDAEQHPMTTTKEVHSTNDSLVEPLTDRELEVLHIMALGKTNQEIAQQLIVARGTVKAHTAAIYRKLDAANRTEAVDRARKLGILP